MWGKKRKSKTMQHNLKESSNLIVVILDVALMNDANDSKQTEDLSKAKIGSICFNVKFLEIFLRNGTGIKQFRLQGGSGGRGVILRSK